MDALGFRFHFLTKTLRPLQTSQGPRSPEQTTETPGAGLRFGIPCLLDAPRSPPPRSGGIPRPSVQFPVKTLVPARNRPRRKRFKAPPGAAPSHRDHPASALRTSCSPAPARGGAGAGSQVPQAFPGKRSGPAPLSRSSCCFKQNGLGGLHGSHNAGYATTGPCSA